MNKFLFELPAPTPTKLEAVKAQHGIETFHSSGLSKSDHPWIALHMPTALAIAREHEDYDDPNWNEASLPTLFGHFCRLFDESGIDATGETEADAVFKLCSRMKLPCDL